MGNESGYENISMFDKQEEFSANVSQKLEPRILRLHGKTAGND